MKNVFYILLLFFVLVFSCFNPLAIADSTTQNFLLRPWAVGQTATYEIKTFDDQNSAYSRQITFSIVGKETIEGSDYFWLEISTGNESVTKIEKLLVSPTEKINFDQLWIGDYTSLNPKRRIRKFDFENSRRLSTATEFEISPTPVADDNTNSFETLHLINNLDPISIEKTSVPAGVFETQDVHHVGAVFNKPSASDQSDQSSTTQLIPYFDAAITDKVPIWGVTRVVFGFKSANGLLPAQEMDLISFNDSGATSQVSEKAYFIPLSKQNLNDSSNGNSVNDQENKQ